MISELTTPPLRLYVHLPWCVRKCPYCDFNSHELKGPLQGPEYLQALVRDLEQDLPLVWGRTVHSVFFGGGTPSLFSADLMAELLSAIRARLTVAPDAEITLEANPGTIERDSFSAYAQAGINRVSLGVQTFNEDRLKAIGRIHGREEIDRSIDSLHRAGLENFNLDLMFGLPGQTLDQATEDVELALEARPAHISHYQLTLEPNTAFAAFPPELPSDSARWDMQEACAERLTAAGMGNYEVSAWARPGRQSRHNLGYWRFDDYLGIGAGAHGKVTLPAENRIERIIKTRHPKRYMDGPPVAERNDIEAADRVFEYFLNVLRLWDGFERNHFQRQTGLPWSTASPFIDQAIQQNLLEPVNKGYRPTPLGRRFNNNLQALFLP